MKSNKIRLLLLIIFIIVASFLFFKIFDIQKNRQSKRNINLADVKDSGVWFYNSMATDEEREKFSYKYLIDDDFITFYYANSKYVENVDHDTGFFLEHFRSADLVKIISENELT